MSIYKKIPLVIPFAFTLVACGGNGGGGGLASSSHVVYTMTNAVAGNAILAFQVNNGVLTNVGDFASGGNGTGSGPTPAAPAGGNDPLGSQNSLVLSPNKRWLFAVNAGSGSVSSFRVANDGSLTLVDTEATGGALPISIAASNSRIYVANLNDPAGGTAGNLTGFNVGSDGKLTAIAGSTHALSSATSRVTDVVFGGDGNELIVTERGTDVLADYAIHADGSLGEPTTVKSASAAPFGIAIHGNVAFVSNAGDASASTYRVNGGALTAVSNSVTNGQKASCWAAFTPDGRHAYTANAGTNNVTTYAVAADGTATIQQMAVATGGATDGPLDAAVSSDGKVYAQLLGGAGKVATFSIDANGNLTLAATSNAVLPAPGAQGLAIR